jgi:hypothetical protein
VINNTNINVIEVINTVPKTITDYVLEQLIAFGDDLSNNEFADRLMAIYSSIEKELKTTSVIKPDNARFSALDCCRLFLLLQFKKKFSRQFMSCLMILIRYADDEEKISIVKGLLLLDTTGEFTEVVIDLCRTNSVDLLAAIGIENPYPSIFFSQDNFNQLVLKLLFCQLDISLVTGLIERKNHKLSRMASDYKQERINANRSIPLNIELII